MDLSNQKLVITPESWDEIQSICYCSCSHGTQLHTAPIQSNGRLCLLRMETGVS